jgi:hypothetical protein
MIRRFIRKMLFSLCFVLLFTIRYVDLTFSVAINDHPLLAGWEKVGIPLDEIEIEGWKKLNQEFLCRAELEELATKLRQRLKLKTSAPPVQGDELDFSYVTLEGQLGEEVQVVITLQSIRGDANQAETYCGVIAMLASPENLAETMLRLKRSFEPLVGEFPLALMLGGVQPGRLSEGEAYHLMKRVFQRLQVAESSGIVDWEYGSWSAWSNLLDGKVMRQGRAINLEFAYRYEEADDQTRIVLASPTLPGYF